MDLDNDGSSLGPLSIPTEETAAFDLLEASDASGGNGHGDVSSSMVTGNINVNCSNQSSSDDKEGGDFDPEEPKSSADEVDVEEFDIPIEGNELNQLLSQQDKANKVILCETFDEVRDAMDQAMAESYIFTFLGRQGKN